MQHFFVDQDISGEHIVISDDELVHQIKNVLRFRVGDECVLLDGRGNKAFAEIETFDKRSFVLKVSKHEKCVMPARAVRLYMALSKKPATFELVLQKATELGVSEIIPLVTARCQVSEIRNLPRLKLIIKEAAEQCERATLPSLCEVEKFDDVIYGYKKDNGVLLAGDAREYDFKLKDLKLKTNEDISLIIGPEGGLTDEELFSIKSAGGKIFILGENVLRMETAAIAALSILQ